MGNTRGLPPPTSVEMADRKQTQSLAEGVDKELTCAICLSRYNQPKILPCLHSYCKGCLQDMMKKPREKKSITCPQCKVVHDIPPQGIDGFATFFTINNLLELLHIHENTEETPQVESLKCTSGLDDNSAVARCLTCSSYLCGSCCTIHQKLNLTRDHEVKTFEEIKQSDKKTGARSLHKRQHCEEHKDKLLELYCKTCKKVICLLCALVTHKQHDYAVVSEVRAEVQKQLEKQISELQAKEIEFQNHQKYTENLLRISNEAAKSSKVKVNKACDDLIEAVEARRAHLLAEVRTIHESEVKQIITESESLALSLLRLSDSIQFTRRLLDNGDDVEVTAVSDQTAQTLTNLKELAWDTSILKPSLLRPEFESLKESIGKFGKVLRMVQPSDIIFDGIPEEVFVGRESNFNVHLSKEISERGYDAVSEITVSCLDTQIDCKVKKHDFNSWMVSFTPDKTGEHKVTVEIGSSVSSSCIINVVENEKCDECVEDIPMTTCSHAMAEDRHVMCLQKEQPQVACRSFYDQKQKSTPGRKTKDSVRQSKGGQSAEGQEWWKISSTVYPYLKAHLSEKR